MTPFQLHLHGRSSPKPMRHPTCICGACGIRSVRWDTYYCASSGVWLEDVCSDQGCSACNERPLKMEVSDA